jgi:hypothetical protein
VDGGVGLRNGGKLFRSLISYLINQLNQADFNIIYSII